jgi:hypothetical protein
MKITIIKNKRIETEEVWLLQPIKRHEIVQLLRNVVFSLDYNDFPEKYQFLFNDVLMINDNDSIIVDKKRRTVQISREQNKGK